MKYKLEEIKKQANYCLHCKTKPCKTGCPLQNNIPDFIEQIKLGKIQEAYKILSDTTIFEPICGRICPHQSQCEGNCVRGIKGRSVSIGELEAFVGDSILEKNVENDVLLEHTDFVRSKAPTDSRISVPSIKEEQIGKRQKSCGYWFRASRNCSSLLFVCKRIRSNVI